MKRTGGEQYSGAPMPCNALYRHKPWFCSPSSAGLTGFREQPMCAAMAVVAKRLLTLGLALTFLIGVTAQLMPPSMPEAQVTISAGMAGGCAGPQPPCTGHTPNCIDHLGCVTISALPTSP